MLELLSLIGKLAFAGKVVPAGRIFLRRLLDLAHSAQRLHHHVHITSDALLDIQWWLDFGSNWIVKAFFVDPQWTPASHLHIFTDASSTLGYGAYWNGAWFSHQWPEHLQHHSIEWKELYAIVMACEAWGSHWSRTHILFHCDNKAVVQIWDTGLSRSSQLMSLVRSLFFIAAKHNTVMIRHIPGLDNSIADALSRLQLSQFRNRRQIQPLPPPLPH